MATKKTTKKTNKKPTSTGGVSKDLAVRPAPKSMSLAVTKPKMNLVSSTGRLSKRKKSKVASITGEASEEIQVLLEEGLNDQAIQMMYKVLMRTVMDLIPYAEEQIRSTNGAKGVYQINSLISNCRELMVDIQMAQDRSELGRSLIEAHVKPAFMDLAMSLVQNYSLIASDAQPLMSSDNYEKFLPILRGHREAHANAMNTTVRGLQDNILQFMER